MFPSDPVATQFLVPALMLVRVTPVGSTTRVGVDLFVLSPTPRTPNWLLPQE